jgi:hypothetical protein
VENGKGEGKGREGSREKERGEHTAVSHKLFYIPAQRDGDGIPVLSQKGTRRRGSVCPSLERELLMVWFEVWMPFLVMSSRSMNDLEVRCGVVF